MLAIVLVLAMLLTGSVMAQDSGTVYCGDLSDADCTILKDAQQAMTSLTSSSFAFDVSFTMSGVPITKDTNSATLGLSGDGAFSANVADMLSLENQIRQGMTDNPSQALTQAVQALAQMLRQVTLQVNLNASVPAELMHGTTLPDLSLEVRMVDGVGYVDMSHLMGTDAPLWYGIDLAGMYEKLGAEIGPMMQQQTQGMDMSGLSDYLSVMSNPDLINKYFTVTRLEDTEVDGQTAAVFESTLDFAGLFNDPDIKAALDKYMQSVMGMMGSEATTMPPGFDMGALMGILFQDTTFRVQETVGLDDHFVHHAEMSMEFNLNMAAMAGMMGPQAGSTAGMPSSVTLSFTGSADLSNFNEPVEVTAPEGATIIDPLKGMSGGSV